MFNFHILSVLHTTYANLDFETKIVEICRKLSGIYFFEVDHSKFYRLFWGSQFSDQLPALE